MEQHSFHLALPTNNLSAIKEFFVDLLGCSTGRMDSTWLDVDFFGHQLTFQEVANAPSTPSNPMHPSLGYPLRHAGLVLSSSNWRRLKEMCDERSIPFAFGPQTLMEGEVGEQQVFMIQDPDENFWEFKCFRDPANLFLKNE